MTITRPVQQVNNPVKAPTSKQVAFHLRTDVIEALDNFCEVNGYAKKEVIDVSLRNYLNLAEPVE